MFYLSVAIIWLAIIFTIKPPTITINYNKTVTVKQDQHLIPVDDNTTPEKEDLTDLPPTLDDVVSVLNETLFEIGGED